MATGLGGEVAVESTEDSVPVVLRVKRKRTEDPAESLGGSQKPLFKWIVDLSISPYEVF